MSLTKDEAEEEIKQYILQMKEIYDGLMSFIDSPESHPEDEFQYLIQVNQQYDIQGDKEKFNHFIELLINISSDHHRQPFFFNRIERILTEYKDTIKSNSTNIEIFEQFSSNKRLLYFLIKSEILIVDDKISRLIEDRIEKNGVRYSDFFLFEITRSDNDTINNDEEIKYYKDHFDEYDAKRKAGENDSYICSLIRQDSVEEFVGYINRTNVSISTIIKPSIFETNSILNEKEPTLIEYAAFFGSIQIFQFLYSSKVKVDGSLWLYGIHSDNSDFLVNYIQYDNIKPTDLTYGESLKESIKCHHNDFANYFQDNLIDPNLGNQKEKNSDITFNERIFDATLKYHNYAFFPIECTENYALFCFYKYNYQYIVDLLYESRKEIIEAKIIFNENNFFFFNGVLK